MTDCDIRTRKKRRKPKDGSFQRAAQRRARDEELVRLISEEKLTIRGAAQRVGMSRSNAQRIAALYGVNRPVGRPSRDDVNAALEAEVDEARRNNRG